MPIDLPSTARLEAFSDGVIAVIITIMVLELKVPRANGLPGLRAILPTLLVYALSFAFTAIYWINHHHLIERIEHADRRILYANLLFLFCLSLLPFFTSWTLDKHLDSFSVALYAVSLLVTGVGFFFLRISVDARVRAEGALAPENAAEQRKHIGSLLLYLVALPTAFYHPLLALALLAGVTLIWIIPTAATHHHPSHPPNPFENPLDPHDHHPGSL